MKWNHSSLVRAIAAALLVISATFAIEFQLDSNTEEVETRHASWLLREAAEVAANDIQSEMLRYVREVRSIWSATSRLESLVDYVDSHPNVLATQVFARVGNYESHSWKTEFQYLRHEPDSFGLSQSEYQAINKDFPIETRMAHEGRITLQSAYTHSMEPVVRITIPIPRKRFRSSTTLVQLDLIPDSVFRIIDSKAPIYTFVADSKGKLVTQSDRDRFDRGEDLSHLEVVRAGLTQKLTSDVRKYKELPGKPPNLATYYKVGQTGWLVVTQLPLDFFSKTNHIPMILVTLVTLLAALALVRSSFPEKMTQKIVKAPFRKRAS